MHKLINLYQTLLFFLLCLILPAVVGNYYLGKDLFHLLLVLSIPVTLWFTWSQQKSIQNIWIRQQNSYSERLVKWGVFLFLITILPSYFQQNTEGLTRFAPAVEVRAVYLLPLFFLPILWLSRVHLQLKHFWWVVLLSSFTVTLVTAIDLYTGVEDRYQRLHGLPIPFGDLSLLLGVWSILGAIFFAQDWSKLQKYLTFILGVGALFASAYSGTRGGWIATPMIIWLLWQWRIISSKILAYLSLSLLSLVLLLLFSFDNPVAHRLLLAIDEVKQLWLTMGAFDDGSIGSRLAMWQVAWQAFVSSPIWGIGIGEYYAFKQSIIDAGLLGEHLARFKHAHNEYLSILSNQGIIGFSFFAIWWLWLWKIFAQSALSNNLTRKAIGLLGGILLVSYMDFCLSESLISSHTGGIFFMMSLLFLLLILDNTKDNQISCD